MTFSFLVFIFPKWLKSLKSLENYYGFYYGQGTLTASELKFTVTSVAEGRKITKIGIQDFHSNPTESINQRELPLPRTPFGSLRRFTLLKDNLSRNSCILELFIYKSFSSPTDPRKCMNTNLYGYFPSWFWRTYPCQGDSVRERSLGRVLIRE